MKYISFDNYYKQSDYNRFIMSAFNNGVPFKEYISIKPPYNWWLAIDDKDVPKFLDYDETKDDMVISIVPSSERILTE